MSSSDLITVDPRILGGVPVKSLFEYLERGYTVEKFVECFPSVTKEMVDEVFAGVEK